jgi:hypothetical protein
MFRRIVCIPEAVAKKLRCASGTSAVGSLCRLVVSVFVMHALSVRPAVAEEATQENLGRAQVLFDAAALHFAEGKLEDACAEYKASYELGHKTTAILNVGICEEKRGRYATAWSAYREAETVATRARNQQLASDAQKRAALIEPKLAKIRIDLNYRLSGLQLQLDGQLIPLAAIRTLLPIDSGRHELAASADGYESWQQTIAVADGGRTEVLLPELKAKPGATVAPMTALNPVVASSPVRTAGYIGLSIGGASLAVGGVIGLIARSNYLGAVGDCRYSTLGCNVDQANSANRARGVADIASTFVVSGGIVVLVGAAMAIFGSHSPTKTTVARDDGTVIAF